MISLSVHRFLTTSKTHTAALLQARCFAAPAGNAKVIKQLRDMTGSPLKDCLKALDESQGDLEKAKDLLRKRGLADAEKRTGRATGEGYVGIRFDKENRLVTVVELTCETDFVAKTDKFIHGIEAVVDTFHSHG